MSTAPNATREPSTGQNSDYDIDAYIATLGPNEREELAFADAAIDIAVLLYRTRERQGLSQTEAAKLAGLHQQAVSRLEQPGSNPRVNTLLRYLKALGYDLDIRPVGASEVGNPDLRAVR